jgi:cyanate permease
MATEELDSRTSWKAAWMTLAILSVSYGSPLLIVVGMKTMQEELGTTRSLLALAGSLVWVGTGAGGIFMGWLSDRIGIRATVTIGACMIAGGLALSSVGTIWALYVGHGLMIGLLGNGGVYPPLLVYVSRWFDRRRGTALALISSGQYIAGVVWPSLFQISIDRVGWQQTMAGFAVIVVVAVVPIALWCLRLSPPSTGAAAAAAAGPSAGTPVLGLRPNTAMLLLAAAPFFCCIPMAMPTAHLVALCSDDGISPEQGTLMLSMLLGLAFASRQFWGWVADSLGGLRTVPPPPSTGWASPASSRPMCWPSATCIPRARQAGACRSCCYPACPAWRWEAGWLVRCSIISVITHPRSSWPSRPT